MTEFESLVMEKLSRIEKSTSANTASVEALNTRLFDGPASVITVLQNDIKEINQDRKSEARWDRFHNIAHYGIPPVLAFLHGVARHFGIDV